MFRCVWIVFALGALPAACAPGRESDHGAVGAGAGPASPAADAMTTDGSGAVDGTLPMEAGSSHSDAGSPGDRATGADTGSPMDARTVTEPRTSADGTLSLDACDGQGPTSIRGRVFDPAGKNPVPNVTVWVPFTTPDAMPAGTTCNCDSLYSGGRLGPYAQTDVTGAFVLSPAPASTIGGAVPLVIQMGKWRTQTTVAVACGSENPIGDGTLRLPGRQPSTPAAATDPPGQLTGDLPEIAISTGGADSLECILTRMGVSESEYTPGAATAGNVHIFQGAPATAPTMPGAPLSFQSLWDSTADLAPYDAILLSCEGAPTMNPNPTALYEYTVGGGRVLATHYHDQWLLGAPWPPLGTWFTQHPNELLNPAFGIVASTLPNGAPFPLAAQMKTWLAEVGALDDIGELLIDRAGHNVDVTAGTVGVPWMYFDPQDSTFPVAATADPLGPQSAVLVSFDTAAPQGEASCGRVMYSEIHVGVSSGDYGEFPNTGPPPGPAITPAGCSSGVELSAQEKALEYVIFDLTACPVLVTPGSGPSTTVPPAP